MHIQLAVMVDNTRKLAETGEIASQRAISVSVLLMLTFWLGAHFVSSLTASDQRLEAQTPASRASARSLQGSVQCPAAENDSGQEDPWPANSIRDPVAYGPGFHAEQRCDVACSVPRGSRGKPHSLESCSSSGKDRDSSFGLVICDVPFGKVISPGSALTGTIAPRCFRVSRFRS